MTPPPGLELWTTFSGVSFDNMILTNNEADAQLLAATFFAAKKVAAIA